MAGSGGRGRARASALEVGGPGADRRWPWAVAAVVAGGLAGAAVALGLRRRRGVAPDEVLEPDEVEAVIDRPTGADGA